VSVCRALFFLFFYQHVEELKQGPLLVSSSAFGLVIFALGASIPKYPSKT
jgi:hypothetical protein